MILFVCQYLPTIYLCTFVLSFRNKAVRGHTAGVQGRVSRWNKLRSSPKCLFLPRCPTDKSVEHPLGHKDLYSPVCECRSTCLSNLWLAHAPTLSNGPAPTHNPINTRAHWARGFIVALVSTRSTSPKTRDLRLGSPSCPSPGIRPDPPDDLSIVIGVLVVILANDLGARRHP